MDDTITLQGEGYHSVLATHPVTRESFKQFLHDTERAVPHALAQPEPGSRSVTYVSQVDALAYCHWQGKRDGTRTACPPFVSFRSLPASSVSREPPPMSGRTSTVSGRK